MNRIGKIVKPYLKNLSICLIICLCGFIVSSKELTNSFIGLILDSQSRSYSRTINNMIRDFPAVNKPTELYRNYINKDEEWKSLNERLQNLAQYYDMGNVMLAIRLGNEFVVTNNSNSEEENTELENYISNQRNANFIKAWTENHKTYTDIYYYGNNSKQNISFFYPIADGDTDHVLTMVIINFDQIFISKYYTVYISSILKNFVYIALMAAIVLLVDVIITRVLNNLRIEEDRRIGERDRRGLEN